MTTVLLAIIVLLWIWAAAASSTVQPHEARLARYAGGRVEVRRVAELRHTPWARLLGALTRRVRGRRKALRVRWDPQELASAGVDPARIEAGRILTGAAGGVLGIGLMAVAHAPAAVLIAVIFALLGYVLPPMVIGLRLESRRSGIRAMLPDVLDFLAVAMRAGQSLEQSLALVAAETTGPLADLIRAARQEIHLGAPREEALRMMGERSGVGEVRELVGHLLRSLRYGASLSNTIQREGAHLRVLLRTRARQRSAEAAVRMLFPLVLFYLPTLFLITMGPIGIRVLDSLRGRLPH